MKIPLNNKWTQTNDGDIFGILNETHNVSFDQNGKLKLSKKTVAHKTDASDISFESVLAILFFSSSIIVVTDDSVYEGAIDGSGFTAISGTPDLFVGSDAMVFNNKLYVTDSTGVDTWDGVSTWVTNVISGLTTNKPHPIELFQSLPNDQIAVGDVSEVKVFDSGHVAGTSLIIEDNYEVTCLVYKNGFMYVGTKEINGGEARIFIWNGSTSSADYSIPVGAGWIMSMVAYQGTVALTTDQGQILVVNGVNVKQLGAFPVFYEQGARWFTGSAAVQGKVFPKGMAVIGDVIYICIEGDVGSGYVQGMKSGLWIFDPIVGLYHSSSPSTDLIVQDSGITVSSDIITTTSAHGLITGDVVTFDTVSGLSGVSTNRKYYAIVLSTTTLNLASNRYDADQGNNIIITGTATSDSLTYVPNTDYGETGQSVVAGAVGVIPFQAVGDPLLATDVIFGVEAVNEAGTKLSLLCGLSDQFNIGWFTTQKIYASEIIEIWKSLTVFLSGIKTSVESLILKYRIEPREGIPTRDLIGTWTSTTVFTTTDLVLRNNVQVGDEIQFIKGQGQGRLAHITAIDTTTSTTITTVTVDEAIGSSSASVTMVVTGFRKIGKGTSIREYVDFFRGVIISLKSTSIQLKVELRGFQTEIPFIELTHSVDKSAL